MGGGRKAVLDGQQRLATTCLLLAAIRDAYAAKGEAAFSSSIAQDYVAKFDREVAQDQPKLILNVDDRDFFHKVVVTSTPSVDPINESQRNLQRAFDLLTANISELVDCAGANWKQRLDNFVKFLDESAQVISITVATEADAFLIFETLNDRGADLTIADLLKNYLFSQAGDRLDEARTAWAITLNNLDTPRVGNQRFTLFARHYMSSLHGVVRERELYQRIKDDVSGASQAVEFSKQLQVNSRLYFALLSPDSDVWADFNESTRQAAEVLALLELEQYRPLLLAALDKFTKVEVQRLVRTMVNWSIRGLAAGKLGGGVAEGAFCGVAKDVRAGSVTTVDQVLADVRIDSLIPNDAVFRAAFETWRIVRGALARYVLSSLELSRRGDPEPELVVNPDVEQVNLEHILPKSARLTDWPQFNSDEMRLYVNRIGNMALLQKGPNGRIGNKPWTNKQPVLAQSALLLTSEASVSVSWDQQAIEGRQAQMATLALTTWPRTPVS